MTSCLFATTSRSVNYSESAQYVGDRFQNMTPTPAAGLVKTIGIFWNFLFRKPADSVPSAPVPVLAMSRAQLDAAPDRSLFRLGHSTVLLKMQGGYWLTDPVFSERASPVQWAGPRRFHETPISIEELPPITGVILSHDHFDHLDQASIRALAAKTEYFVTPIGVGDTLIAWGVDPAKVHQRDWWESVTLNGLRLVATPSQHFSGRGLFDGNQTLWASWVILDDDFRIFFSGDTGYFDGFKAIGNRFGPFDLTLMETGAYDEQWPDIHMLPEQTLQAHVDLGGRWLLPIHNGTFDLAMHAWHAPFERISVLADAANISLATPRMGEPLDMNKLETGERWWRELHDGELVEAR
ncbi:MBL fold metallo-hydrolase [Pseudomonas anguilliseptica]|uniref:MBL fold metallo-hydrolase n=1 Tax=Pseudomonas anguilliseptica TaxID=53406 RepID=UPI0037368357